MDPDHIEWATAKGDAEHVSISSFVTRFRYSDRHTAEQDFQALINSPEISNARRQRLITSFRRFNSNRADVFWARRTTIAKADVIAMEAATANMEVGHQQSKVIYQKYLQPQGVADDEAEDGDGDGDGAEAWAGDGAETEDQSENEDEDGGAAVAKEDFLDDEEMSNLLANISMAQHPTCTWLSGDTCNACLFQQYQRECIQAFRDNRLRKADIADVMAVIGVFAPFLPTDRMRKTFEPGILSQLAISPDLPDPGFDDAAIIKAVRLRMNNRREEASEAIREVERTIRLLFDNLLESLPDEADRSISEVTFTVNYVAPVLNSILRLNGITDVHYPNTESSVQKIQGLKPDRPDILVKACGYEIMYGEITDPCMATCKAKTNCDLFRLARFGKSFLDRGGDLVPLLQVVHKNGLAMRLVFKARGVYLLERVGRFTIPCSVATVPALLATLPVLLNTRWRSRQFRTIS